MRTRARARMCVCAEPIGAEELPCHLRKKGTTAAATIIHGVAKNADVLVRRARRVH